MPELWYADLGRIGYSECTSFQRRLAERRWAGDIADTMLLLEHDPVITLGRSGGEQSILTAGEELRRAGVELVRTDRGGSVTYHGPGQLVGYPIFDLRLRGRDVHRFLRNIEQAIVGCLEDFGISGRAVSGYTGVWVGREKICSIGIAVRRWISYHGFALNVSPNFEHWSMIHPCGLRGRKVTSLELLAGRPVEMEMVKASVVDRFARVFGLEPVRKDAVSLLEGSPMASPAKDPANRAGVEGSAG